MRPHAATVAAALLTAVSDARAYPINVLYETDVDDPDGFGEQFLLSFAGYGDLVNHVVAAQVPTGINVQDTFSSTGLALEVCRDATPAVQLPAGAGLLAAALTLTGLTSARRRQCAVGG